MENTKERKLEWRVHTPNLIKEITANNIGVTNAIARPLDIFGKLLYKVGERAAELNDPELNKLMCRLTIYSIADPESPDYDKEKLDEILEYNTG